MGAAFSVTLSWNGTSMTQPALIFQDEMQVINGNVLHNLSISVAGALLCSSSSPSGVTWHFTNSDQVPDSPASVFQQTRKTGNISLALLSRGSHRLDSSARSSGLWLCRLNGSTVEMPVAIYRRNEK